MSKEFTARVIEWNKAAGNTSDNFNVRQAAMYFGLQLEEISEKLDAMPLIDVRAFELIAIKNNLALLSDAFKSGKHDELMKRADRIALLDADCDIAVVTTGSMMSQGADVHGALAEVCDSNDSKSVKCPSDNCTEFSLPKFIGDVITPACAICNGRGWILQKNEHGKIIKGVNYREPDLSSFVCNSTFEQCGKKSNGIECSLPKGSKCPDCSGSGHMVGDGD